MKRSDNRILTTHTGFLSPRPRPDGSLAPRPSAPAQVKEAVRELVDAQLEIGIDIVNNGDIMIGYSPMAFDEVLNGVEKVERNDSPFTRGVPNPDMERFATFYEGNPYMGGNVPPFRQVNSGPISSKGTEKLEWDIQVLKDATDGHDVADLFMCVMSPGWAARVLWNESYPSQEAQIYAIAEGLKPLYRAIVDAGLILQVDTPDIVDDWTWDRWTDLTAYRKNLEMRIDALNGALEGLPEESIRYHLCWGSHYGPHSGDLPLGDILDLAFKVNGQGVSLEAAKASHEHEWKAIEESGVPDGKILMPGVIDHTTPIIEHPQVIAERIVRYARLAGRENVIAATDCGMRGDAGVDWAKYESIVKGAALASETLWN